MIELKKELYQQCLAYVQNRIAAAKQALEDVQTAANDETKSSAGDKYETGREMMQQQTNRNQALLHEANKLKVALNLISTKGGKEAAGPGSLVITDNGCFYLAISAGILTVNNEEYYAVSPASPIGQKLKGLKIGNKFTLNDKCYLVKQII
jgi:hypothetical protein